MKGKIEGRSREGRSGKRKSTQGAVGRAGDGRQERKSRKGGADEEGQMSRKGKTRGEGGQVQMVFRGRSVPIGHICSQLNGVGGSCFL